MQIVIEIPEGVLDELHTCKFPIHEAYRLCKIIEDGKPLPKGHGRLIDADAFIDELKDTSKRQKYNECFIGKYLSVDDVFNAIIESLENKGLAAGDAPTIIEADTEGAEE